MSDRVLAAKFAIRAVDLLTSQDCGGRVVGIKDNKIIDMDIDAALAVERTFDCELYKVATILGK